MSAWTDGYIAEVDYTFGYYTKMNPPQQQEFLATIDDVALRQSTRDLLRNQQFRRDCGSRVRTA
ncbi:MAG TPA: methyltransferase regulatory domain-containing protein [Stellaceae bacterium]|nr:methyltransferase regulatory domain-containing protein [Stellaceae bacterium]